MPQSRLTRNFIHIISRNSNWPEKDIDCALTDDVYAGQKAWRKFLDLFLLALGVGFAVSGIIFFFAYNWNDLHKFAKIGIAGALVVACVLVAVFALVRQTVRNTLLTGAAMLVGALFAVFGQVYQTGADSWELFFIWTVFITAWAVVSNFAPLWLLFITLVNATLALYWYQSGPADSICLYELLFAVDAGFVIACEILSRKGKLQRPGWLIATVSLFAAGIITFGIIVCIFDHSVSVSQLLLFLILPVIVFALGVVYGIKSQSTFYPTVVSFCVIAILSAVLVRLVSDPIAATFLAGIFIIGSIAILTWQIIQLNKQWHGKKQ